MIGRMSLELMRPVARAALWRADWQLRRFLKGLRDCRGVQDRLWATILRANHQSDLGRRHGFAAIRSYSDFVRAVPAAHFSYYAPYVERCKAGDLGALFGPSERLLMFAVTSGTTDSPKHIPVTARFMAAYRQGWNLWIAKYLADHPQAYLRKVFQVSNSCENELTAVCCPKTIGIRPPWLTGPAARWASIFPRSGSTMATIPSGTSACSPPKAA